MTLEELRVRFPSLAADRRLLRNDVYAVLLAGIVAGDLAPGERLKDAELTEALRVSRTPVREAVSRLAQVGLIRTAPNRYTLVSPLDDDELAGVIGVLRLLLPPATRQALCGIDVDAELELTVVAERLEREPQASAVDAFQRACSALLDAVHDRVLVEMIQILLPRFFRFLSLSDDTAAIASRGRVLAFARAVARGDEHAVALIEEMLDGLAAVLSSRVGEAG